MKLTDSQIKAIKPIGRKQIFTDGKGLILVVTKAGAKKWHFRYDRPNTYKRTQNELSIGEYPFVSLKRAREIRDEHRVQLSQGIAPTILRRQEKFKRAVESQ